MKRICALLTALLILPRLAHAEPDWIDEFPSVTVVAHAAFEELKVTSEMSKLDMTHDDDSIALNLVGTLIVLRHVMFFEYVAEPGMSREREDKLRKLVATYEEAELAIGKGAAGRRGYITRGAPTGMGCKDLECYRRWFLLHVNAHSSRAEYRERILKRLFPCDDRGKILNDLYQKNVLKSPYFPTAAVTLKIEPEIVGIGPAGCTTYGGDANNNGLCDDWEKVPVKDTATTNAAACTPVIMDKVRMEKDSGLRVTYAKGGAQPGMTVHFRVLRVDGPANNAGGAEVWSGDAIVQGPSATDATLLSIIAQGAALAPDATRPYLVVEATTPRPAKPVHCEQPLATWLQRQLDRGPKGFHGPYTTAEQAVFLAGQIALKLTTEEQESGFLIMKDRRIAQGRYYATPPRRSAGKLIFQPADYGESMLDAFDGSCEEEDSFALAATVHTHPDARLAFVDWPSDIPARVCLGDSNASCFRNDYFSMADFNQAIELSKLHPNATLIAGKASPWTLFEKIILVAARTRCVQTFAPLPDDQPFTGVEEALEFMTAYAIPRVAADRYDQLWKRQVQAYCYK